MKYKNTRFDPATTFRKSLAIASGFIFFAAATLFIEPTLSHAQQPQSQPTTTFDFALVLRKKGDCLPCWPDGSGGEVAPQPIPIPTPRTKPSTIRPNIIKKNKNPEWPDGTGGTAAMQF